MGRRCTLVSCVASLGLFALGATFGSHRTRRRERRRQQQLLLDERRDVATRMRRRDLAAVRAAAAAAAATSSVPSSSLSSSSGVAAGGSGGANIGGASSGGDGEASGDGSASPSGRHGAALVSKNGTRSLVSTSACCCRSQSTRNHENQQSTQMPITDHNHATNANHSPSVLAVEDDVDDDEEEDDDDVMEGGMLDCPVCLTELVLPRVTACGHTICTACLVALGAHERRPQCPVCRRRIRMPVERLAVNFVVRACVEERVSRRGRLALRAYRDAENAARACISAGGVGGGGVVLGGGGGGEGGVGVAEDGVGAGVGGSGREDGSDVGGGSVMGGGGGSTGSSSGGEGLAVRLRPAWTWLKWSVIIATEFGAFLVSLKEVMETGPSRSSRRYQRIV